MFLIQNVPPLFLQHFGIFADPTKHKSPFGLLCKEFYLTPLDGATAPIQLNT